MIRKLILTGVFFGLIDVVLISCCKDSLLDYTKFNSIKVTNTNLKDEVPDSSTISKGNYRIKLTLDGGFIAINPNRQLFMNSSYATFCENMGLNGLKSDIVTFEVTCNKEVFGTPSGQKLSLDKIKAYEFGFYDDTKNERLAIDKWVDILNNGRYEQAHYDLYLEFNENIVSTEYLKFKIKIEFQDGLILEAETNNIRVT